MFKKKQDTYPYNKNLSKKKTFFVRKKIESNFILRRYTILYVTWEKLEANRKLLIWWGVFSFSTFPSSSLHFHQRRTNIALARLDSPKKTIGKMIARMLKMRRVIETSSSLLKLFFMKTLFFNFASSLKKNRLMKQIRV